MEIRGHGGRIEVEVFNYERPTARDEHDANWLKAKCSVVVGEFTCVLRFSPATHDFIQFLAQLEEVVRQLKGNATFNTLGGELAVQIKIRSAGQADVFGRARSQSSLVPDQTALSFSFETHESFLAHALRELRTIVTQFPVRTANSR